MDSIVMEAKKTVSTHDDLFGSKRRAIRSSYREIQNRIHEGKDEIADVSSKELIAIMNEVENIHQYVKKPHEQVADAEALLGLTSILVTSVKSHSWDSVAPFEFVSCLIRKFGQWKKRKGFSDNSCNVKWRALGSRASPIFMSYSGCRTMIGPMKKELKQWKTGVRAKRARSVKKTLAEELETKVELVTGTDWIIHVMFEILKKKKKAEVESLILNRQSFAQTIENLFALSFLVKDGRVHIDVEETGAQVIVPRNGPSSEEIKTGVAKNHQFMFRLGFDDWKLMKRSVPDGEEVMPQRYTFDINSCSAAKSSERDFDIPEGFPINSVREPFYRNQEENGAEKQKGILYN